MLFCLLPSSDPLFSHVVLQDECWVYDYLDRLGYGSCCRKGKIIGAHRQAWVLTFGDIPDGLDVLHTCDNRACINPNHLFLGTHQDNMTDMKLKGRGRNHGLSGERHPAAHYTDAQIEECKRLRSQGMIYKDIAKHLGCSHKTVEAWCNGRKRNPIAHLDHVI